MDRLIDRIHANPFTVVFEQVHLFDLYCWFNPTNSGYPHKFNRLIHTALLIKCTTEDHKVPRPRQASMSLTVDRCHCASTTHYHTPNGTEEAKQASLSKSIYLSVYMHSRLAFQRSGMLEYIFPLPYPSLAVPISCSIFGRNTSLRPANTSRHTGRSSSSVSLSPTSHCPRSFALSACSSTQPRYPRFPVPVRWQRAGGGVASDAASPVNVAVCVTYAARLSHCKA
jgi:hypothetical protein